MGDLFQFPLGILLLLICYCKQEYIFRPALVRTQLKHSAFAEYEGIFILTTLKRGSQEANGCGVCKESSPVVATVREPSFELHHRMRPLTQSKKVSPWIYGDSS